MFDKYQMQAKERFNLNNLYYIDNKRASMEIVVPKNTQAYFEFYTIEKGDSLYGIAKRYNINPTLLASLNGLNIEDYIYPGQEILIPKSNYSYYLTAEGDTLDSVANTFSVSKNDLLQENEIIYLLADQLLVHKKN